MKTIRQLKISSQYQRRKTIWDQLFPKLVISGKWFQKAGFAPGDQANIEVHPDCIIIWRASK